MIVWLASYPKSGNTWLRHFLACLYSGRRVSINELGALGFVTDSRQNFYEELSGKTVDQLTEAEIPLLRLKVQRLIEQRLKPLAFVKTHTALIAENGVPAIDFATTAAAIYVVRDPRDVAVSYAKHYGIEVGKAVDFLTDDRTTIGENVYYRLGSWEAHARSWVNSKVPKCVYKYEEMRRDPVGTARDIAKFLKLKRSRPQLRKSLADASLERARREEAKRGFEEASDKAQRFFGEGKIGGWQGKLTREQVARIEGKCADTMKRFGYELET